MNLFVLRTTNRIALKKTVLHRIASRWWLLLALAALLGLAAYLWTMPLRAERRWQHASLDQLQAASRQEPSNARVFFYLGLHLQGLGQMGAAQAAYARAVALDPAGMTAILQDLRQKGARATLLPTDRLVQDANLLLAHSQVADAERAYTTILIRDPKSALSYYSLGLIWESQGKTDEAFRAYNRAIHLQPDLLEAQYHLALLYYGSGFPDEAERRMKILVAEAPKVSRYWYGLGNCVKDDDARNLDAEADFRRAANLDSRSGECALALADTEAKGHQDAAAERDYRQALTLSPGDPAPSLALGLFLLDRRFSPDGQAEAVRLLRSALALSPHDPAALTGLGQAALNQGKPQEAVGLLEDAEVHSPGDPKIWYVLGTAYSRLGNMKRADYCRAASTGLSAYIRQLGFVQELAQQHLKDPLLRLKLARLYAQGGQYARAINQYQMCRRLDPGNPSVPKELATLTKQLRKTGQMPSMSSFNGMVIASVKNQPLPTQTTPP